MGHLLKLMEDLIAVFHTYSGREGDKYKLSKAELKNLLQDEFSELMGGCNDPEEVDKIMTDLDENKDGEVDFQEFILMVAALTVACNEFFVGCKKGCRKDAEEEEECVSKKA